MGRGGSPCVARKEEEERRRDGLVGGGREKREKRKMSKRAAVSFSRAAAAAGRRRFNLQNVPHRGRMVPFEQNPAEGSVGGAAQSARGAQWVAWQRPRRGGRESMKARTHRNWLVGLDPSRLDRRPPNPACTPLTFDAGHLHRPSFLSFFLPSPFLSLSRHVHHPAIGHARSPVDLPGPPPASLFVRLSRDSSPDYVCLAPGQIADNSGGLIATVIDVLNKPQQGKASIGVSLSSHISPSRTRALALSFASAADEDALTERPCLRLQVMKSLLSSRGLSRLLSFRRTRLSTSSLPLRAASEGETSGGRSLSGESTLEDVSP
jgi:hypothetical protein